MECRKWSHIPIKNLMSPIKHIVKGSDPVLKALAIMTNTQSFVLPVVDGGLVIGVIRLKEIFTTLTARCNIWHALLFTAAKSYAPAKRHYLLLQSGLAAEALRCAAMQT